MKKKHIAVIITSIAFCFRKLGHCPKDYITKLSHFGIAAIIKREDKKPYITYIISLKQKQNVFVSKNIIYIEFVGKDVL